ncbi:MAG: site-specific recombinase [Gammaproteobacteria bacterium]
MKTWFKPRATPAERIREQIEKALTPLAQAEPAQQVECLARLVDALRPRRSEQDDPAQRLRELTGLVRARPALRATLRTTLMRLLAEKQAVHLFTDSGVLASDGFSTALSRRLAESLLPAVLNPEHLKDVFSLLFPRRSDYRWVQAAGHQAWLDLAHSLDFGADHTQEKARLASQVLGALEVISYRITAIGLEPELVRNHPAIERHESPFLTQNAETRAFIDDWRAAQTDKRPRAVDGRQIEVLLDQCEEIIAKIRKQAARGGASVSLTYLLVRLEQNIARFHALMSLLESTPQESLEHAVELFLMFAEAENRRNSVSDLFAHNVELLAQRITGNAGKTGEHYIANSRREYWDLFRSALGAGFIVAFMALLKIDMSMESHAPIVTAFLYSMNYGLGFVLIYMLHFTIATKQPAMTASTIAASIRSTEKQPDRLENLADLVVRTLRSQFIAIVGNVLLAGLTGALVATLILVQAGEHFIGAEQAGKLLWELDPLDSPALAHAGIAGVCLFLAGLISGYFDNKAIYNRIPERIAQLRSLRRLLGAARARRLGDYVGDNLGGLTGNFFFGCMLGSMGTIGHILGLPLDIRHITFAAANYAYALVSLDFAVPIQVVLWSGLGVIGIGLMNLGVSFSLALFVALRSQRVEFADTRLLIGKIFQRFMRQPVYFFLPPPDPPAPPPAEDAAPARSPGT